MSKNTYESYATILYKQVELMWSRHHKEIIAGMETCLENSGGTRSADGLLEVVVSFDGSWMTRGHRSHIGVGFVIDIHNGFILDLEVLCNFCQLCSKKEKKVSAEEFALWKESHTNCSKNFAGKSGAMETEAAVRMWQRSEARGFHYTQFIGDGDSAAFNAVCALNSVAGPYGTTPAIKEECVNHVAKRMGSRLPN